MGGKGGGSTNTVQQADPWVGQQPYLQNAYRWAQQNFQAPPQYYPNATYVPFSSQSENALGMAENRALSGSPVESAMQNWVTGTLGGGGTQDYLQSLMGQNPQYFGGQMGQTPRGALNQSASGQMLNANPYVNAMFGEASRGVTDRFNESVMPSINATFGGAGRTGSGAHALSAGRAAGDLGDSLAGMAANIYGGNYANERGLQMNAANALNADDLARRNMNQGMYQFNQGLGLNAAQEANRMMIGAAGMAPTAASFDWNNINQLRNVGQQVEGMAGNVLGDSMNRFNYYQNLPDQQLANYIAAIQGNVGGTTSTTQTGGGSNPLVGAAGGALTGAALSSAIGSLGGGAAAGGAAGGASSGAALGPWGMIGGALLGALMS